MQMLRSFARGRPAPTMHVLTSHARLQCTTPTDPPAHVVELCPYRPYICQNHDCDDKHKHQVKHCCDVCIHACDSTTMQWVWLVCAQAVGLRCST